MYAVVWYGTITCCERHKTRDVVSSSIQLPPCESFSRTFYDDIHSNVRYHTINNYNLYRTKSKMENSVGTSSAFNMISSPIDIAWSTPSRMHCWLWSNITFIIVCTAHVLRNPTKERATGDANLLRCFTQTIVGLSCTFPIPYPRLARGILDASC